MESGWWSVVPPVVAILLAIRTRRVIASLLLGTVVGTAILKDWSVNANPLTVLADLCETHLWASLCDPDHVRVFVFTALMGAMIGVIHRTGGMQGVVRALAPLARSRRGGQLLTWLLGLLIFIDDYANTLLLGHTMRPLMDRLRISREKLAYLVDSTAAPVAGLALISTWVAGEIGYIEAGYANLDLGPDVVDGFTVFVATIPYRFYVLWTLLFVPLVALLGRDFGPMLTAERDTLARTAAGHLADATAARSAGEDHQTRWYNALVPILVTLAATFYFLLLTGSREVGDALDGLSSSRRLIQTVGQGDSYLALVYGSLVGLLTAIAMGRLQRIISAAQTRVAAFRGATLVLPALTILWLAWALSGITSSDHLGTGEFLGSQLQHAIDVRWMPTVVFLLASGVAFATGTSWGTMGILMPIVVDATYRMMQSQMRDTDPYSPLLLASVGSVLAGAIFGDHCSPISDTTVLSSQASGCNHMAHVWTQLPYALTVGAVAVLGGTLPVGFGVPLWILMLIGPLVLAATLLLLGKRVPDG